METKQKLNNPTKNIDPIDKIWNDNPKIPFMQSKEILALGYKYGKESVNSSTFNNSTKENVKNESDSNGFTSTSKELTKYANNKGKNNKNNKLDYSQENQIKLDIYNDILVAIQHKQNLLDVYTYCKDKADNLKNIVPINRRR